MASAEHVSKQVQPYLPGMAPQPSEVKQAHEMTPEEFASHPLTVFHSSKGNFATPNEPEYPGYRNLHNKESLSTRPMHVGTRRAAIHRAGARSSSDEQDLYAFHTAPRPALTKTTLADHVLGHKAERAIDMLGKEKYLKEASLPSADWEEETGYYHNIVEDPGSVSAVIKSPRGELTSHHEAVAKAIAAGKIDEVHPLTLHMYKSGQLGAPEKIHPEHSRMVETAARVERAGKPGESDTQVSDALLSSQVAGTQRAWAFGGALNTGLTRSPQNPFSRSGFLGTEKTDKDPRLGAGPLNTDERMELARAESERSPRANREELAEKGRFNDVVEDTGYTAMRSHPDVTQPRGPELDRIRHYYRAGGFTQ